MRAAQEAQEAEEAEAEDEEAEEEAEVVPLSEAPPDAKRARLGTVGTARNSGRTCG